MMSKSDVKSALIGVAIFLCVPFALWATQDEATRSDTLKVSAGKRLVVAYAKADSMHLTLGTIFNWDAGDVTLTHAAGKLTYGGDGAVELDFNNHEMTNIDVNSGAIDGTTIGAASAAAGTFTTIASPAITSTAAITLTPTTDVILPDDKDLALGTGADALLSYNGTNTVWNLRAVGTGNLLLNNGLVIIGDGTTTSNAGMTIGLTIDIRGNDNQAINLRSSDVNQPATNLAEAPTFGFIQKNGAAEGGLRIIGMTDADATGGEGSMVLEAYSGDATVTQTDASTTRGVMEFQAWKTDGGTSRTALTGNDAAFVFAAGTTSIAVLQAEGELHIANTTLAALDDRDDALLARAAQRYLSRDIGIAIGKWDEGLKGRMAELEELGVMNSDMLSVQGMFALHGGALWQGYERDMMQVEEVEKLRGRVAFLEDAVRVLSGWKTQPPYEIQWGN